MDSPWVIGRERAGAVPAGAERRASPVRPAHGFPSGAAACDTPRWGPAGRPGGGGGPPPRGGRRARWHRHRTVPAPAPAIVGAIAAEKVGGIFPGWGRFVVGMPV